MTRIEYDLLRIEFPELRLPPYLHLDDRYRAHVGHLTRDRLIARRASAILSSGTGRIRNPCAYWDDPEPEP